VLKKHYFVFYSCKNRKTSFSFNEKGQSENEESLNKQMRIAKRIDNEIELGI